MGGQGAQGKFFLPPGKFSSEPNGQLYRIGTGFKTEKKQLLSMGRLKPTCLLGGSQLFQVCDKFRVKILDGFVSIALLYVLVKEFKQRFGDSEVPSLIADFGYACIFAVPMLQDLCNAHPYYKFVKFVFPLAVLHYCTLGSSQEQMANSVQPLLVSWYKIPKKIMAALMGNNINVGIEHHRILVC